MHHSRGKSKNTKAANAPKQKISYEKKADPAITEYAVRALNWLRKAEFLMSAPKLNLCVEDSGYEVAFAGRSNAGKSSAINALTNQKQLARASKKPGRTQMINFFSLGNPEQRLVDLPGYGYAAVPESMKIVWQKELENYLIHRKSLQGLVLLMDIRHPLQHFDVMMLEWAYSRHLFVHVLLTKSDKLNRGPANKVLLEVKQQLKKMKLDFSIQLFSSLNRQGLEELASVMAGRLNFTLEQSQQFDLASIPEATADELEAEELPDTEAVEQLTETAAKEP
ncbi:ribosome biogenesis GTP-binding protein YihA/YsxC [Acinetobacter indicus]|jgi:GTP-binding protein|uniref:Probable GTP-binding protein EngB n=1 Tax=Acinetobacter indicus CIP 110367 TaxID=1341679 RepID=V2U1A5_9GAMM|nr:MULTISPECIES: ribosome biogenesis GTP-binding protein YihA/YsxC [Acinetobacter]ENW88999.1 ribosome biogenesis GTP-binding protein YsxC [Acinetobacter sp. CIP 53.82]EPF74123.1 ribosome biogenesis GTP-binding protein YsxC [Acinetobacter indicus ANC 4215]ESK48013.1 ribosome biogenesis GTP-binding protein YsxC [Acinetobacter indicus CIP 110367]KJV45450.1 GTP-binding protein [Acinetobacter indicus]MBA0154845.1 YihA family ribosome biogenesis GTP-binding protein [Acinetobacter indicus]